MEVGEAGFPRVPWRLKVREVLRLARAEHGAMVSIAVLAGYLAAGGRSLLSALAACVATFFIEVALFATNDIFNLEEDRLNRPERPLVRGTISLREAWLVVVTSMTLGVLLSYLLGTAPLALASAALLLGLLYNVRLKREAFFGNLLVALLTSISFAYGAYCAAAQLPARVSVYVLIALAANIGREIIKGVRDLEGDMRAGICTLPCEVGVRQSASIAAIFIALAIAMSLAAVPLFSHVYLALITVTDLLFAYSAWLVLVKPFEGAERARGLTLIGMLFAVLALLFSNLF